MRQLKSIRQKEIASVEVETQRKKRAVGPDTFFSTWRDITFVFPLLLIMLAWASILGAFAAHQQILFNHDYLLQTSHLPWIIALVIFLVCWQVMLLAMMLPSVLPLLLLMRDGLRTARVCWWRQIFFMFGYALVWTGFALFAFLSDTGIHWLVAHWLWLYLHSWMIGTMLLAVAGIFQMTPGKQWCLQRCCFPYDTYLPTVRQETKVMWGQGMRYGRYCLGSCWALMFVQFGLGMSSFLWMALGAMLLVVEKGVPTRYRFSHMVGVMFLLLALLWALLPVGLLNSV